MKKITFLYAVAFFGLGSMGSVWAQNETDALRYSQLQFGGTARIQGIAGAQTALGADLSSLSGNPAGLGMYRRSDAGLSTALSFGSMETKFLGASSVDNKDNFNIPNLGFVLTNYKGDDSEDDWRSFSFGVAFTRQAHFHNRVNFTGVNNESSIVDYFHALGATRPESSFYDELDQGIISPDGMAFDNFLLNFGLFVDPETGDTLDYYVPYPVLTGGGVRQTEEIVGRGALNQWDISLGTNYRDKLFLGASIGFTSVNYRQRRTFTEENESNGSPLNKLVYNDEFKTTGSGINLKVGAIFMPIDWLRVGATIQTPTFTTLQDTYSSNLSAEYSRNFNLPYPDDTLGAVQAGNYDSSTLPGEFDYNLTTPFRATGGVSAIVGRHGFISADIEYVDYSNSRFSTETTGDNFTFTNNLIKQRYTSAINLRVGAEGRYEIFRVRAGFAHYGDPLANSSIDQARTYYTGGAGIKMERYYFDLAYVHSFYNSAYQSYTLPDAVTPGAVTKNTYNTVMATFGVTF